MRNLTSQIGPPLRGFGVHRKNFSKKVSEVGRPDSNHQGTFAKSYKNGLTYMFFVFWGGWGRGLYEVTFWTLILGLTFSDFGVRVNFFARVGKCCGVLVFGLFW